MKLDWLTSWNSAADFIKIFRKNRILEIEIQKLSEQKPIGDFCRAPEMITPSTSTNQFFNMSKLSPHKIAPIFNKENFPRAKRKHVTGESKRVIGQLRHQA